MKKLLNLTVVLGLLALLLVPCGTALAAASETFVFPSSGSTVVGSLGFIDAEQIGWFWSVSRGDTVYETFNTSLPSINGAILDIEVVGNVLSSGAQVDWDVEINDVAVLQYGSLEGAWIQGSYIPELVLGCLEYALAFIGVGDGVGITEGNVRSSFLDGVHVANTAPGPTGGGNASFPLHYLHYAGSDRIP